ncbi:transposase [Streptococcus pneumoniae]|nr:transposase [Streptococcus pneumoniae]
MNAFLEELSQAYPCYGAVDAYTGESFFLRAGGCNTEWMNAFLEELSQAYPFTRYGQCYMA